MKRFMKFMLAFVLTVMCLIPSVGAVKNDEGTGTIKITGAKAEEYSIYQILKLDSYANIDGEEGLGEDDGYVYTTGASADWDAFVKSDDIKGKYLNIDDENYVTWVKDADVVEFSELALKYAKDHGITPTATQKSNGNEVTFTGLNYGYYLVDSSLGALCALDTTRPDVTIAEKNSEPTVSKTVLDNDGKYKDSNTAFIGETVYFEAKVTTSTGTETLVLTDVLSNGLTLNGESVVAKYNDTTLVKGTDYTITTEEHKFVLTFEPEYVLGLEANSVIVVTYNAELNENAVVGSTGNTNEVTLSYGGHSSVKSTTTTYTYGFDIVKTDKDANVLVGAQFRLYDAEKGGNEICLEYVQAENYYRVNHGATSCALIDGTNSGHITIKGLEAKTYYLEETLNPDGYAKLLNREKIEITGDNYAQVENNKWVTGGLRVINYKGSLLPDTGGIGTALFITLGSFMVVLFGILLVAKVRMSKEN